MTSRSFPGSAGVPGSRGALGAPGSSRALGELARLLVPLACAGCGRPDVVLCTPCLASVSGPPRVVDTLPGGNARAVYSVGPYDGRARAVVLAWKGGRRRDLGPPLARLGEDAGRSLATELGEVAALVPAPSGLGRRLGGRLVAADLACAVARGLAGAGVGATDGVGARTGEVSVLDLLVRSGGTQAGRDARGRSARRVRALARLPPGLPVLLVDDVLTTGATLGACAAAVREAGGEVVGAFTLVHARGSREVPTESASEARDTGPPA